MGPCLGERNIFWIYAVNDYELIDLNPRPPPPGSLGGGAFSSSFLLQALVN